MLLRSYIADPTVHYVVTVPGSPGAGVAFVAEVVISLVLMSVVLRMSNNPRLHRFTGLCAGLLVATYITLEAPLSGMSMNPARTFGSALSAQVWTVLWLYFLAPPLGMLLAAELYVRRHGAQRVRCAKLHHHNTRRCIFHCGYAGAWPAGVSRPLASSGGGPGAVTQAQAVIGGQETPLARVREVKEPSVPPSVRPAWR